MKQLAQAAIEPQRITDLIKADQYDAITKIIIDAQAKAQADDKILEALLSIAELTCQAAVQCTNELVWLRQAETLASDRIAEYKAALCEIFELVAEVKRIQAEQKQNPPPNATPALPTIETGAGPWKALNLLNFLRSLLSSQPSPGQSASKEILLLQAETNQPYLPADTPRLVIYCLGAFKVYRDNQLVGTWRGFKGQSIFKYLLHHRDVPVLKDVLMELFWPGVKPEAAQRNLHQAIYSIRRTLRGEQSQFQTIKFENDCYLLDPNMSVWVDVEEFSRRVKIGTDLEKRGFRAEALVEYSVAEGLYQSDFLEEDLYEDWIIPLRQQYRDAYIDLADRLSECYLQQSEYTAAMALCRKIIKIERCQESAYRRLMKCYLAQGQRHLAIRQYLTCVEVLHDDLALLPSEETVTLYRSLVPA